METTTETEENPTRLSNNSTDEVNDSEKVIEFLQNESLIEKDLDI